MIHIETKSKVSARQLRALQLREMGFTYKEIARMLGYCDASGARKAVARAGRQTLIELTENYRNQRYEQLEMLKRPYMARTLAGDLKSARFVVKIITQEVRLFGLMGRKREP